jgi:hypothetical protein
MDENTMNNAKEIETYTMAANLKEQNINILMHLSKNKMLAPAVRLIGVGFGFTIFTLGILGTLWLTSIMWNGYLRWAILIFTSIIAIYMFIFPIGIDKKREQYDQEFVDILRKNKEVLAKYENYLHSKKDS